jgi:hypothetical protein
MAKSSSIRSIPSSSTRYGHRPTWHACLAREPKGKRLRAGIPVDGLWDIIGNLLDRSPRKKCCKLFCCGGVRCNLIRNGSSHCSATYFSPIPNRSPQMRNGLFIREQAVTFFSGSSKDALRRLRFPSCLGRPSCSWIENHPQIKHRAHSGCHPKRH